MTTTRAWLLAARPKTLPAAAAPVLVGTAVAVAEDGMRVGAACCALLGAMAIQVGTNFANDVFDYEKGADDEDRLGPTRAVQSGLLTPSAMKRGMVVAFLVATLAGLYLTSVAGPVIVAIGVISIAAGIGYTAGPWPLAYLGLGDVFVMIFFGFVAVLGTAYVQTQTFSWLALWAAVPVGGISTAILVVNNVRDRETDVRANKRTLAVRFGRRFGVAEYVLLIGASFLTPVALFATGRAGAWVLLPVATLPLAIRLVRAVAQDEGPALNEALAGTARLLMVFALTLSIGLVA